MLHFLFLIRKNFSKKNRKKKITKIKIVSKNNMLIIFLLCKIYIIQLNKISCMYDTDEIKRCEVGNYSENCTNVLIGPLMARI